MADHRLHIGFVLPSLSGRRADRTTLHLAQWLIERGHRADLVVSRFAGDYRADAAAVCAADLMARAVPVVVRARNDIAGDYTLGKCMPHLVPLRRRRLGRTCREVVGQHFSYRRKEA